MKDCQKKNVVLDGNIIHEKEWSLYSCFTSEAPNELWPGTSSEDPQPVTSFQASKGWFDHKLKRVIKEKGYRPEKIFNADGIVLEDDAWRVYS